MSDNPIEWLESQQRYRRIRDGKDLTPQQLGNDFLTMKPIERLNVLSELDSKISSASLSLLDAQKLHSYRSKLVAAHQAAGRVKR
jgi:hypothetical protein